MEYIRSSENLLARIYQGRSNYYYRTKHGVDFVFYEWDVYIIDKSTVPENCYPYLTDNKTNPYALCALRGKLPMTRYELGVRSHASSKLCSDPSFGTFLFGTYQSEENFPKFFILFHPTKTITPLDKNIFMVDDKPTMCCVIGPERISSFNQDIILVNVDGKIPDTQVIHESYDSDEKIYKTPNGYFKINTSSLWSIPENLSWTYFADKDDLTSTK
jgi:hypothetical protein